MISYSFTSFCKEIKSTITIKEYCVHLTNSVPLIPAPGRINISIFHAHSYLLLLLIYTSINILKYFFKLHVHFLNEYVILEFALFCSKYCFSYNIFINIAICVSFSKEYTWVIDYVSFHLYLKLPKMSCISLLLFRVYEGPKHLFLTKSSLTRQFISIMMDVK